MRTYFVTKMNKLTSTLMAAIFYFTPGCGGLMSGLPTGYSPFSEGEMPRYGAVVQNKDSLSLQVGGCLSKNAVIYFQKKGGLTEDKILSKYANHGGALQKLRNILGMHRPRFGLTK